MHGQIQNRGSVFRLAFPGRMILGILAGLILLLPASCQQNAGPPLPAEKKREIANALFNRQLYAQAVEEYRDYLLRYPLSAREQTNIAYQIATIYFERLNDYENALAYYVMAKYYYPESPLQKQISKRMVECLERLNRSGDARQVVSREAALDASQKLESRPGEVIARIGDRTITTGDLEHQINRLPEYLRNQMSGREQKREFLKQYIAQELLYDSAKRRGLDSDKDVIEGTFQAKKALMVEKLLAEEIEKEAGIENYRNSDVETYYQANKEKYAERDKDGKVVRIKPFSEVAQQVGRDFVQAKKQEALQRIIERLMEAEKVTIYDDKIR